MIPLIFPNAVMAPLDDEVATYVTPHVLGLAEHYWYIPVTFDPDPKHPMIYGWNNVVA
jgi:hypothetical protein